MMKMLKWRDFAESGEAFHVARIELKKASRVVAHGHADYMELLLVESGSLLQTINGRQTVLEKGALLLIRPQDTHGLRPVGKGAVFVNIAIPIGLVDDLQQRYFPPASAPWNLQSENPPLFTLDQAVQIRLTGRIDLLARAPRTRFEIDCFLMNLLRELRVPSIENKSGEMPNWLASACREIQNADLCREGLPAFVKLAGRSPEHVSRVLKKCTGKTPTQLINEARLTESARRLCMTSDGILEIAAVCGFDNPAYFYRLFKQKYGQPPRRYRVTNRAAAGAA
ncbi:MAG: AraC family transcriptional regulator [Kiritimatiellaceae bacterium]|nr:AraC family transcriptional regulator [Kiritimatiellaceae bacterium]